jgi:hypothetical protein
MAHMIAPAIGMGVHQKRSDQERIGDWSEA